MEDKKLNILAIFSESIAGRLISQSMVDGFEYFGHKIFSFDELKDEKSKLFDIVSNNHIDFLLGYDFSAIKHKQNFDLKIKTINYFSDVIQDNLSGKGWENFYPLLKKADNYTFYWDKALYTEQKKVIKNIYYLPHFLNTEIYRSYGKTRRHGVLFAGRLNTEFRLNLLLDLMKKFNNLSFVWYAHKSHFENALSRCQNEIERVLLTKAYKGFIETEKDMADALNESKIVVNFQAQGKSSVNYRTLQAMACGCLMICDYRDEIPELFDMTSEIVCYKTQDELENYLDFYIKNTDKAQKIAQKGSLRIKKDLNSQVGVSKILDVILKVV